MVPGICAIPTVAEGVGIAVPVASTSLATGIAVPVASASLTTGIAAPVVSTSLSAVIPVPLTSAISIASTIVPTLREGGRGLKGKAAVRAPVNVKLNRQGKGDAGNGN